MMPALVIIRLPGTSINAPPKAELYGSGSHTAVVAAAVTAVVRAIDRQGRTTRVWAIIRLRVILTNALPVAVGCGKTSHTDTHGNTQAQLQCVLASRRWRRGKT